MLRIHNTLSGQVEEFRPLVAGEAKFYYCGPTVWDYGHIGNFRSAIAADVIRRYLKFKGLRVTQVMKSVLLDTKVVQMKPDANGMRVTFEGAREPQGERGDDVPKEQSFDRVLIAVGRRPNSNIRVLGRL